ncbi:MAG: hypothetical protein HY814_05955 [Candidatus Riflebacteria bacterium]|nr:hypothetical protein [Candidatus Riflebacteria bacterium]
MKAFYRTPAGRLIESLNDSGNIGVYFPAKVAPVVLCDRFVPSSYTPPVGNKGGKFTFQYEVYDSDSDLQEVTLQLGSIAGSPFTVWPTSGKSATEMSNRFHVSSLSWQPTGGFALSSVGAITDVELIAKDAANQTSSCRLAEPIVVTNTAPVLSSFRSDRTAIIRGSNPPKCLTTVTISVDAQDAENNLKEIELGWNKGPDNYTSNTGTLSRTFAVSTTGTAVVFTARALDLVGAVTVGTLEIVPYADETPPETAVVSLNNANTYLTAHPLRCELDDSRAIGVNNWYVTDNRNLTGTWSSFEVDTPPVKYKIAVATSMVTSWTTATNATVVDPGTGRVCQANAEGKIAVPGAITIDRNSGAYGWASPSPETTESYTFSVARGEMTTLEEGRRYYLGVQAVNSANPPLANRTFSPPRNPSTGCLQNGFALDATPPTVGQILVDTPALCASFVPVINGINGLTARWPNSADNAGGSGLSAWSYTLVAKNPNPPDQTLFDVRDYRASEVNALSITGQAGKSLVLAVKARDAAGNESLTATSLTVRVDNTPPYALARPLITNLTNGILTDPNHFEGRWDNVFIDNEESGQPLSFDWGISTTQPIRGIPDRSPGGWQQAGTNISGSIDQTNLLANGDTVYLVVRATNCANSTSIETYSAPALVRTDIFSRLSASPVAGFQPLSVEFKLEVVGGTGPFDFTFTFSNNPLDTATQSVASSPFTSVIGNHTYTLIGSHRCFGQVVDSQGHRSFALASVQVLPQPYALVLGNASVGAVDLNPSLATLMRPLLSPAGVVPSRMKLIELSDSLRFLLFTAAGAGAALGGVYRLDLDSAQPSLIATEGADDLSDDLSVASDVITLLVSNRRGGARSLRRVRLDPGFNYRSQTNLDTVFSMGIGSPTPGPGQPTAVAIMPDGKSAVAIDAGGPLFTNVFGLDLAQPRVSATSTLALSLPGYADLSADGSLLALTDRGAARLLLAHLATSSGESQITSSRIVDMGTMRTSDVELSADGLHAYVAEEGGTRVAKVLVSTGAILAVTSVATGRVSGLDVSRDGTLLLVGDDAGQVRLLDARTFNVISMVGLEDGCRDVAFFERPSFGKPVVTGLSPAAVAQGGTVDVRGYNLGPRSSLRADLLGEGSTATRTAPVVAGGSNGFNTVRVQVPSDYPKGPATIVVYTSQGNSGTPAAARVTVQ